MQVYGQAFARVYDLRWSGFARQIAPPIIEFYSGTEVGRINKTVLDLCCGTGHLAVHLLEKGYNVVGVDLSADMLRHAQRNAARFVQTGQAKFIKGDACDFELNERFGLVLSTYDSLNHLENEKALKDCFRCVHDVCEGYFIFDLNTQFGLKRWNSIMVDEGKGDAVIITRGIYDGQSDRAWTRITGFVLLPDGLYERFEETVFNTVFKMDRVREILYEVGWKKVSFARISDLKTSLGEPELEPRVFVVASK